MANALDARRTKKHRGVKSAGAVKRKVFILVPTATRM
jgi:hypothetical protein